MAKILGFRRSGKNLVFTTEASANKGFAILKLTQEDTNTLLEDVKVAIRSAPRYYYGGSSGSRPTGLNKKALEWFNKKGAFTLGEAVTLLFSLHKNERNVGVVCPTGQEYIEALFDTLIKQAPELFNGVSGKYTVRLPIDGIVAETSKDVALLFRNSNNAEFEAIKELVKEALEPLVPGILTQAARRVVEKDIKAKEQEIAKLMEAQAAINKDVSKLKSKLKEA